MVSTKEVYRRKTPNLVSKIVKSGTHVQHLARNVFIAERPIISKKFANPNEMAGVQALKIVDGVSGILSKQSIHSVLLDRTTIYLLLMPLRPSQERKLKFTAQRKLTANQLN